MHLNFTLNFSDLNTLEGLLKLDQIFLDYLAKQDHELGEELIAYRNRYCEERSNVIARSEATRQSHETRVMHVLPPEIATPLSEARSDILHSEFLLRLAPYLDDFIAELFFIEKENFGLKEIAQEFDIIYECRRKFVQRVWKDYCNNKEPKTHDVIPAQAGISGGNDQYYSQPHKIATSSRAARNDDFSSKTFAQKVMNWLKSPDEFAKELADAAEYACRMVANNSPLPLFNIPRSVDQTNLLREHKIKMLEQHQYIGFDYRDHEINFENALAGAKYCIYCHKQNKDSCRTGITTAPSEPRNNGCPLDQKISEMNKLFAEGFNIGALGVVVIDNPLVAATGHRICNDCMKSCIFQKQDPVNVPMIESQILNNVLNLPYGAEIYSLLVKWNPLNILSPLPKEQTNHNVLVVGLGPAGFALSHYLLNEGHNVVAIDGLKIDPLSFDLTKPIKDWRAIKTTLSARKPQGFGGVAEYGITNRWDKNNLTLVRLLLERRNNFKMMGGIRLGSNITQAQAFDLGFDHIALCTGASRPRYINSESYFFKGVKSAADFLMNLQQGGSFLSGSNSKLLIRMPAVIIGCGLTAVDSAVEIMHYYPTQVEKFLSSYEQNKIDLNKLDIEDKEIAEEFITHAKLFRVASSDKEKIDILQSLGGVKICYRSILKNSAAYKRNHEEIEHAKSIGIKFEENLTPLEVIADNYDYAKNIQFKEPNGNVIIMPARTVLVAIGTEENGLNRHSDSSINISYFGDCNPLYAGSVVKALASAKDGYKEISKRLFAKSDHTVILREGVARPSGSSLSLSLSQISLDPDGRPKGLPQDEECELVTFLSLSQTLNANLKSTVHHIKNLSPDIIELIVKSPLAAKNYQAGQIFRVQNFSVLIENTTEPIALSPYEVDSKTGLISFLIAKVGNSTKLCSKLKKNDEVALMGPVGSVIASPCNGRGNPRRDDKTVILVGQDIRNLALLPLAKELKSQGKEVIFLAHYTKTTDRLYADKIENVADKVIWSCEGGLSKVNREQDEAVMGELIETLKRHCEERSDVAIPRGLRRFYSRPHEIATPLAGARNDVVWPQEAPRNDVFPSIILYLPDKILAQIKTSFSANNITCNLLLPMQCMMKGICGQCIAKTDDKEGYIFACANSEYSLDKINPQVIGARLKQNSLLEKV